MATLNDFLEWGRYWPAPIRENWGLFLDTILFGSGTGINAPYQFSSDTGIDDPGSGYAKINNVAPGVATVMCVSLLNRDGGSEALIMSAIRENDIIGLRSEVDSDEYIFKVDGPPVDHTTWLEFPVEVLSSGGTLVNDEDIVFGLVTHSANAFLELIDTPESYVGEAGAVPVINDAEDALEFHPYVPIENFFNGTFVESFDARVTSTGTVVTMSLEQAGTGDLTMRFSDGETILDCTPAQTIILTPGTDPVPVPNHIYILQSTKVLTISTSEWPTAEHIKVAYILVPSAVDVQNFGPYINQNWNDHRMGTSEQGHLAHLCEAIRLTMGGACWHNGIAGAVGGDYVQIVSGAPDNVWWKSTSGYCFQMHPHAIDAIDTSGTDEIRVLNWLGDAYHNIQDIADIVVDANGNTLQGRYFNLVFWGVANKTGEYSPLMCNLPNGSYNQAASAISDVSGYDVSGIPTEYIQNSTIGFLICRMTFYYSSAGGGTWTLQDTQDYRGLAPGAIGGVSGGGVGVSTFLELVDTPATYLGESGKIATVNIAENALEFTVNPAVITTFLGLSDTPTNYTGESGKIATVNIAENALEFTSPPSLVTTFLGLSDTPANYTGHGTKIVGVKADETGLDYDGNRVVSEGILYIDRASFPVIYLREGSSAVDYSVFSESGSILTLMKVADAGQALIRLDPRPDDGTGNALFQFWRTTNTSGQRSFSMFLGNGSATVQHFFNAGSGVVQLCKTAGALYIDTPSTPSIYLREGASSTDYTRFRENSGSSYWSKIAATGNASMRIDPVCSDGVGIAEILFFRDTNTTGQRYISILSGDGSAQSQHLIYASSGNLLLCRYAGALYIETPSTPSIYLREGGSGTDYTILKEAASTATFSKIAATGSASMRIGPIPSDGTSGANLQFFRDTNTSGGRYLYIYVGNGTSTIQHLFNAGTGDVDLCINGNGNAARPTYAGSDLALFSDIPSLTGYLPLTAGASYPLSGTLYLDYGTGIIMEDSGSTDRSLVGYNSLGFYAGVTALNSYIFAATLTLDAQTAILMRRNNKPLQGWTTTNVARTMLLLNSINEVQLGSTSLNTLVEGAQVRLKGIVTGSGNPTTSHFGNGKWGAYRDTSGNKTYMVINYNSTVYKIELT